MGCGEFNTATSETAKSGLISYGGEKVDFCGTLRQEGIKKTFFELIFFCIERDSSPRPDGRGAEFRARPDG